MDYYLVSYSSINTAIKVKNSFRYGDEFLSLQQTPKALALNGCSYSIRVRADDLNDVIRASDAVGSQIIGVYRINKNGYYSKAGRYY